MRTRGFHAPDYQEFGFVFVRSTNSIYINSTFSAVMITTKAAMNLSAEKATFISPKNQKKSRKKHFETEMPGKYLESGVYLIAAFYFFVVTLIF
jgi:hypothetical protein